MVSVHHDGTIEFAFFRPTALSVRLAGDFNNWNPAGHPLLRDRDGWWRLKLSLPPGEYGFKYLVDGKLWEADFAAFGVEPDRFGGWRSVLFIEPRTGHATGTTPTASTVSTARHAA